MKKITTLILIVLLQLTVSGCVYRQKDSLLKWFDVTKFNQELIDMCSGDGYENIIKGDPYYCPLYTQEDLDPKLELYMEELSLTFVKGLGVSNVYTALEQLKIDFEEPISDNEVLLRVDFVNFYTCIALDEYQNEKIVYLAAHTPKGIDKNAYIYDNPLELTYKKLEDIIETHQGESFEFTISYSNGFVQTYKVYLNDELFNNIFFAKDSNLFLGELFYECTLCTYVLVEEEWILADNNLYTPIIFYILYEDDLMKGYYHKGFTDYGASIYETAFELAVNLD
ncbi:MAG: hypothetical protein KJ971_08090 [Firmicutes bacterium]|nr:hypothetical protein [Bacillota bacterium]